MQSIWEQMVELLANGQSFVTATIVNKSGSVPRADGAKMIVKSNGSIIGTIGGGKLEAEARVLARQVFLSRSPIIQKFDLTSNDAARTEMICGGKGEFLLDFIDYQDSNNLEIYNGIRQVLKKREKAWLITGIGTESNNNGERQQCLINNKGTLIGQFECEQEFLHKLISGPAKINIHSEILGDQRLLVEPIRTTGILYIFGAGHVSQQIAPIAELVGFKTVVVDDRAEYANKERFPLSDIILLPSFTEPLPDMQIDRDSYLVIVTRGHLHDKKILGQVLKSPAAYVGMIGSKRKRDMIYSALQQEQGFEKQDFARVYAPIGTAILAETPEEIAVSIVGELIKVRAETENVFA